MSAGGWLLGLLAAGGVLFAAKAVYALSVALSIGTTRGALFVSSPGPRVAAALEAVEPARGGLLADLGCGDGRILRAAVRDHGMRAVGYEVNPVAWLAAKLRCAGDPDIRVVFRDFRTADLGEADVVTCYLFPDALAPIARAFRSGALKPKGTLVSFNFPLPGVAPDRVLRPEGSRCGDPIYIYRNP